MIRLLFLLITLALPASLFAMSDEFTIGLTISDTDVPTTPVIQTLIPISPSAIDITWSTSTDSSGIGGYRVFRDGTPIATTTLTNYSDTGLSASTSYTYQIDAFDAFQKYSALSAPIGTTTLQTVVVGTSTPTTTGEQYRFSRGRVTLEDFLITPYTTTADISWSTRGESRYELRWGRTDSYEIGYVTNSTYSRNHSTTIISLEPGTKYYFELRGYNDNVTPVILKRSTFTTKSEIGTNQVPNVNSLSARVVDGSVELEWNNPEFKNFASVKVIRNHFFYPLDSFDGFQVYSGENSSFLDVNALTSNSVQYYTVFVVDIFGNTSSGAIIAVRSNNTSDDSLPPLFYPGIQDEEGNNNQVPTTTNFTLSSSSELTEDNGYFTLNPSLVEIWQNRLLGDFSNGETIVSTDKPYTLRIATTSLPRHLKSIIVTLTDPVSNDRVFSFILKINQSGDAYEATLSPSYAAGMSSVRLEVVDFQAKKMQTLMHSILYVENISTPLFPDKIYDMASKYWIYALLPLLLFILILFMLLRRSEDNAS